MTYPASTTPDVTVSTAAALESQLSAWAADWAGTVPSGKTTSDERMVGVDTSISDVIDMTNLTFPQKVWIRSVGTFTDYDCSVKFTGAAPGQVDLTGSTNIWLFLLHIVGSERLVVNQTQSCGAVRCFLQAEDVASPAGHDFASFGYTVAIENGLNDFSFEHCNIGWYSILLYTQSGAVDGLTIDSCVFDWANHDSVHNTATLTNYTVRRNWFCRRFSADAAVDGKHEDGFQQSGGSTDGALFWGNVLFLNKDFWYGGSQGSNQGIFFGDQFPGENVEVTQNIIATNSNAIKWGDNLGTSASDLGSSADYNTVITIDGLNYATIATADGNLTRTHNFVVANGSTFSDTGGIGVDLQSATTPVYTAADAYFAVRCPRDGDHVQTLEPATGQGIHWSDAGQKSGAYLRLQEIFETGGDYVPGNVGWPVAGVWTDAFNPDGGLSTTHTGTYDSDGNNPSGGSSSTQAARLGSVPLTIGGQVLRVSA